MITLRYLDESADKVFAGSHAITRLSRRTKHPNARPACRISGRAPHWAVASVAVLKSDQREKGRYDNSAGGYRIATSVGGTITGEGRSPDRGRRSFELLQGSVRGDAERRRERNDSVFPARAGMNRQSRGTSCPAFAVVGKFSKQGTLRDTIGNRLRRPRSVLRGPDGDRTAKMILFDNGRHHEQNAMRASPEHAAAQSAARSGRTRSCARDELSRGWARCGLQGWFRAQGEYLAAETDRDHAQRIAEIAAVTVSVPKFRTPGFFADQESC